MLKNKFAIGFKKICNTKQYDRAIPISWGSYDIDIALSYCFVLHIFLNPIANLFFSMFIIECFLHPLDETQLGRNRSRVIDMM